MIQTALITMRTLSKNKTSHTTQQHKTRRTIFHTTSWHYKYKWL